MWCVYAAIGNYTQSIKNIKKIISIITNKFYYNINSNFILAFLSKNPDIITKANILPVISDDKRLYSMKSGERVPMSVVYL